jgi:hypothetical protein
MNDMLLDKINNILGCYRLHGNRLHPLGKVICDGQNKLVAFARWRINFADHVHAQPLNCGRTNLNYTGSSTRVLNEGLLRTSNGIKLLVCRVTSR